MDWLFLLIGIVVGGAAAWFLGKAQARDSMAIVRQQIEQKDNEILELRKHYDEERVGHAALKSKLEEKEQALADQRAFIDESKTMLSDSFGKLSKTALGENNQQFLVLAKSAMETLIADAKGDLGKRQQAINDLLTPLNEVLKQYDNHVQQLGQSLKSDYGSVGEQSRTAISLNEALQKQVGNLVQALRSPQTRGRWGELTLRKAAELAGMEKECDFEEQVSVASDTGQLRPDMIVHLPSGRDIVVDAKVPLAAYLDMIEATSDEDRVRHLGRHATQVRAHMAKLSQKEYWRQFAQAPDLVVMFVPGESILGAALQQEPSLFEEGIRLKVVIASPVTFIALLRTVAIVWREEQMKENVERIRALGAEMHDRIATFARHFTAIGNSVEKAADAYLRARSSLESRVLVSARKFKELGATAQGEIPEIPNIETVSSSDVTEAPPE